MGYIFMFLLGMVIGGFLAMLGSFNDREVGRMKKIKAWGLYNTKTKKLCKLTFESVDDAEINKSDEEKIVRVVIAIDE